MKTVDNKNEQCFVLLKKVGAHQDWLRAENLDALILLEHICLYLPEEVLLRTLMQDKFRYMNMRLLDLCRMNSIFAISDISFGEVNIELVYPSVFTIKGTVRQPVFGSPVKVVD